MEEITRQVTGQDKTCSTTKIILCTAYSLDKAAANDYYFHLDPGANKAICSYPAELFQEQSLQL